MRSPPTAFSSRTSSRPVDPARAELREALEGRPRRLRDLDRPGSEDRLRELARLDQVACAPERGNELRRRTGCLGELLVGHRGDRVDRQAADPREIEVHVVRGLSELLEVGPESHGGDAGLSQVGHGRDRAVALGELLAVVAEQEAVVDVLRRLEAECARELDLLLGVRAMVGAADDGRDPEVVVVDDAGEVVGRRAVGTEQGQPAEPQRPLVILGADRRGRLAVALETAALAHRPVVPIDAEPAQVVGDRVGRALELAAGVGVVDAEEQPLAAPPVGDGRERAAEMERPGRARREAGAARHRPNLTGRRARFRVTPRRSGAIGGAWQGRRERPYRRDTGATEDAAHAPPSVPERRWRSL